jgi:ribosomal-protein-alanine N-acetyltransferase
MYEVETERLLLRPFTEADVPAWHGDITADLEVMRWLATGRALTLEETAARLPAHREHWATHGYGTWGIFDRADDALAGFAGLHFTEEVLQTEVHYALARAHHGRGIATEATKASLRFGFEVVGLERIVAYAMQDNAGSIKVLEKAGMAYEAIQHVWGFDAVVYAMARADFVPEGRFEAREWAP